MFFYYIIVLTLIKSKLIVNELEIKKMKNEDNIMEL